MSYRGKRKQPFGNRRGHKAGQSDNQEGTVDESNPIIQVFRIYQNRLDEKHDRHERIVKLSRDITIESKRTIFLLHRISGDQNRDSLLAEAEAKLEEIQQTKWRPVARELQDQDAYQFLRAYSPGLQEYIEALAFYHYQKHQGLLTMEQVEERLRFAQDPAAATPEQDPAAATLEEGQAQQQDVQEPVDADMSTSGDTNGSPMETVTLPMTAGLPTQEVHVPPLEYVLGLADLTGELMRLAINSVGGGSTDEAFQLCSFMQQIHAALVACGGGTRELWRKITVLHASIKKVETACYTVGVRGSEIPKHMLAEALLAVPTEQMLGSMEQEAG